MTRKLTTTPTAASDGLVRRIVDASDHTYFFTLIFLFSCTLSVGITCARRVIINFYDCVCPSILSSMDNAQT